jgi:TolA-binding protein
MITRGMMSKNKDVNKNDSEIISQKLEDKSLTIKVDNSLNRIDASLNNYTQLLTSLEKKLLINSVLVYIVFLIITVGFLYIIFDQKNKSLEDSNKLLNITISKNIEDSKNYKETINGYKTTKNKIKLLLDEFQNTTSDPKKLVDDFTAMDKSFFSSVEELFFESKVNKLKLDLSIKFYENGKNFFESNSYDKALKEFTESLKYNSKNPYINEINFFMGVSYLRTKKYSEAVKYLEKSMVNNFDRKKADDILYSLGNAYEKLSNVIKAKEYYKKIIEEYSTGDKYWDAKKRWNILNNK